jgi:hypothetical protein
VNRHLGAAFCVIDQVEISCEAPIVAGVTATIEHPSIRSDTVTRNPVSPPHRGHFKG